MFSVYIERDEVVYFSLESYYLHSVGPEKWTEMYWAWAALQLRLHCYLRFHSGEGLDYGHLNCVVRYIFPEDGGMRFLLWRLVPAYQTTQRLVSADRNTEPRPQQTNDEPSQFSMNWQTPQCYLTFTCCWRYDLSWAPQTVALHCLSGMSRHSCFVARRLGQ
jgi:hypothetical protein